MFGISSIVILVIVANVLISQKGFRDALFFEKHKFQIAAIRHKKEYIRLVSSAFLHVDVMHLAFNMITFYFFADVVVFKGSGFFCLVYFGSLFAGNLLTLFFHRNEPLYSAVGASGAVTGILFSAILLYPDIDLVMIFLPIPIPGYVFAILYLGYTLYGMKKKSDTIGHTAHFGGAVGGMLMTFLCFPLLVLQAQKTLLILSIAVLAVGAILLRKKR